MDHRVIRQGRSSVASRGRACCYGGLFIAIVVLSHYAAGLEITIPETSVDLNELNNGAPVIETDRLGTWVSVWARLHSGHYEVHVSRSSDDGTSWSDATILHPSFDAGVYDDFLVPIDLTTDGIGNWALLLAGIQDSQDLLICRSSDNGASWGAPTPFYADVSGARERGPSVVTNRVGTWIITFHRSFDEEAYYTYYCRSTDAGASWSAPQLIHPSELPSSDDLVYPHWPRLAATTSGRWLVVWNSSHNPGGLYGDDMDIFASHSEDDGLSWSAPGVVNSNAPIEGASGIRPVVVMDDLGHATAVWYSPFDFHGTGDTRYDVFSSRSDDFGATWDPVMQVSPSGSATGAGYGFLWLDLTTDRNGTVIATWSSDTTPGVEAPTESSIYAACTVDNGASWAAPVRLTPSTGSLHREAPRIACDEKDTWITTYANGYLGIPNGIYTVTFRTEPDSEAPAFTDVTVSTGLAEVHDKVRIRFETTEPLVGAATVSVSGNPAEQVSGYVYPDTQVFEYTVNQGDPLGPALVEISGTDKAGFVGSWASPILTIAVSVPVAGTGGLLVLVFILTGIAVKRICKV